MFGRGEGWKGVSWEDALFTDELITDSRPASKMGPALRADLHPALLGLQPGSAPGCSAQEPRVSREPSSPPPGLSPVTKLEAKNGKGLPSLWRWWSWWWGEVIVV